MEDDNKRYGSDRMLESNSPAWNERKAEADRMRASGEYSVVEFNEDSGGIFAIEKGTEHKIEEKEAGRYMAASGYVVTLTDEGGSAESPDGRVFDYVFEQATPKPQRPVTEESGKKSVKNALEHGVEKVRKAEREGRNFPLDAAVIYDKHHSYNRKHVREGIKEFQKYGKFRYKTIIVISSGGIVYEHFHTDV